MQISEEDIKRFHDFESSNNLDSLSYRGSNIWPVIRYAVFYYILSDHYQYKKRNFSSGKLKHFFKSILSLKSFICLFKKTDILLFDYGRNALIGGGQYNPTTFTFVKSLSDKYTITIIDLYGVIEKNSYPGIDVIDISYFLKYFRVFSRFVNTQEWNSCLKIIDRSIIKDYKKEINLKSIFSNVYIHQFAIAFFTKLAIKIKKPKGMIYSDNASLSMAIHYARQNNVVTIDYQHSLMSKLNILYSHPDNLEENYRNYLSEYVMTYGSYWFKYYNVSYKVSAVGSLQQDLSINQLNDVKKDKNCITIVSGIISRQVLVEIALIVSHKFPSLKIFYKLRPEECSNWRDFYPEEIKLNKSIFFIDNNERELCYYLKKSEYVIGINSSVLIEAMPFSKVIVYQNGWSVEMADIISLGYAIEAKNHKELVRIIENNVGPIKKIKNSEFFKPNTIDNIRIEISKLI